MGLFRRRRPGLEYDLLGSPESTQKASPPPVVTPGRGRYVAERCGPGESPFHVSGTIHRQDALAQVGSGHRLFQLVREPSNPYDSTAVQVVCEGVHIGYLAAVNSSRYTAAISEIEATGKQVFVHGQVLKQGNQHRTRWIAMIDCPWPEDF